ncbi:MAG: hypothetical protein LBQ83_04490 [Candidatus Margulisbacteria bacterium]|jgi:hypothetical protein|nr:hypothetical protein [Candidatus Margulisiibacteriota bacterium]
MNNPEKIIFELNKNMPQDEQIKLVRVDKEKEYISKLEVSVPISVTPNQLKWMLQSIGITMDFTVTRNETGNLVVDFGNAEPSVLEVKQGEYKISDKTLTTAGLETCTALGFSINGKNFLAHIDANTGIERIISNIKESFTEAELQNTIFYVWEGMSIMSSTGSGLSRGKVDEILEGIGARPDNINTSTVLYMDKVTAGNN